MYMLDWCVHNGEKYTVNRKIKDNSIFSASEVGQFTYCARSWFLKREGYRSPPSKKKSHGKVIHHHLGKSTHQFRILGQLSYVLILLGSILFFLIIILKVYAYIW